VFYIKCIFYFALNVFVTNIRGLHLTFDRNALKSLCNVVVIMF
jgi:hypothetical protein